MSSGQRALVQHQDILTASPCYGQNDTSRRAAILIALPLHTARLARSDKDHDQIGTVIALTEPMIARHPPLGALVITGIPYAPGSVLLGNAFMLKQYSLLLGLAWLQQRHQRTTHTQSQPPA